MVPSGVAVDPWRIFCALGAIWKKISEWKWLEFRVFDGLWNPSRAWFDLFLRPSPKVATSGKSGAREFSKVTKFNSTDDLEKEIREPGRKRKEEKNVIMKWWEKNNGNRKPRNPFKNSLGLIWGHLVVIEKSFEFHFYDKTRIADVFEVLRWRNVTLTLIDKEKSQLDRKGKRDQFK